VARSARLRTARPSIPRSWTYESRDRKLSFTARPRGGGGGWGGGGLRDRRARQCELQHAVRRALPVPYVTEEIVPLLRELARRRRLGRKAR